MLASRRFFRVG